MKSPTLALLKRILLVLLCLALLGAVSLVAVNARVKAVGGESIVNEDACAEADCILVLGCGITAQGKPSAMLEDRLATALRLYERRVSRRLLLSGDHGSTSYDEVNAMKSWLLERGVPEEAIFTDHAGFSTYESVVRAKEVFCVGSAVIVTQEYHLYRALYLAEKFGIEAQGVSASLREYTYQNRRDAREVLARAKDFVYSVLRPKPTYLGEQMPISGDGRVTVG